MDFHVFALEHTLSKTMETNMADSFFLFNHRMDWNKKKNQAGIQSWQTFITRFTTPKVFQKTVNAVNEVLRFGVNKHKNLPFNS